MSFLYSIIYSFFIIFDWVINNDDISPHAGYSAVKGCGQIAGITPFQAPFHDGCIAIFYLYPRKKIPRSIGLCRRIILFLDHVPGCPGKLRSDRTVIGYRYDLIFYILPIAPVSKISEGIRFSKPGRQIDNQIFNWLPCFFIYDFFLIGCLQGIAQIIL